MSAGEVRFLKKTTIDQNDRRRQRLARARVIQVEVAVVGFGEMFGEEEIFANTNRNTTCMAHSSEVVILSIPKEEFLKRVGKIQMKELESKSQEKLKLHKKRVTSV